MARPCSFPSSFTLPSVRAKHSEHSRTGWAFAAIFASVLVAHATLLRLPYFWDEAGYYIPFARDFFLTGNLIPTSTLSNAHPPLPVFYLALAWKLFGYSPLITRTAMLLVASFALLQVYLLGKRVANREVAIAATICSAVYPVFFAQSSLAHADLPATALTLWGLRLYMEDRRRACVVAFALAALAKETAIVTPLALFAWEVVARYVAPKFAPNHRLRDSFLLFLPAIPLALWFAYHYHRTGYVFGNPEFFKYNVAATLDPLRIVLALVRRLWQTFGHMNMWVLTFAMLGAMLLPPIRQDGATRERISIPIQLIFAVLILAHIVMHSIVGGAVLARYMMPVIPLAILIGISTLWRRVMEWKWVVALICFTFVAGWFVNPPYGFAPEDNLNYADFVRLHQRAADYVQRKFPHSQVLTAWPATDELNKPYLGYVNNPIRVIQIQDFSFDQLMLAKESNDYDVALLFSTKYEPPRRLIHWQFWERANARFFGMHADIAPDLAAQMLGGTIVMQERRNGQWIAIVEIPRIRNVKVEAAPSLLSLR
jgi:hypothetical protein